MDAEEPGDSCGGPLCIKKVMKDIVSMIPETKTDAGIRDIPTTQMVYDAFRKRELNLMLGFASNVEIGGRSGFIFNTKHRSRRANSFLKNIVNAYNKKEKQTGRRKRRVADASYFIILVIRDVPDWVRTMSIPKLCSM